MTHRAPRDLRSPLTRRRLAAVIGLLLVSSFNGRDAVDARTAADDDLVPSWQILALVYETTDFSYVDTQGVEHRVVGSLTPQEVAGAEAILAQFTAADVPALTSGHQYPTLTVRRRPALTRLSQIGQRSWWPAPDDLDIDRDLSFDSIIVVWQTVGVNVPTGTREDLSAEFGGLGYSIGTKQTYLSTSIFGRNLFGFGRNLLKHEWGHGILFYYDLSGAAPKPAVNNHINNTDTQYVNCRTGASYILVDETDQTPIPNSIYNNESGFTHDYYSGTTARADDPTRCLGITPAAWKTGGPVTKTGGIKPGSAVPPSPGNLQATVVGDTVTLAWPSAPGALSYRVVAGTIPGGADAYHGNVGVTNAVTATNVPPGTYYVRVHTVGPFAESTASDEVRVDVAPPAPCLPVAPVLNAAVTGTTVILTWASLPGVTAYTLEVGSTSGAMDLVTLGLASSTNSFTESAAPPGTYFVRLRAHAGCAGGDSVLSNEVRVDVPPTPCAAEAPALVVAISGDAVTLTWEPVSGATGYTLEVGSATGAVDRGRFGFASSATGFTAQAVPPGAYFVRLRAETGCGTGPPSSELRIDIP